MFTKIKNLSLKSKLYLILSITIVLSTIVIMKSNTYNVSSALDTKGVIQKEIIGKNVYNTLYIEIPSELISKVATSDLDLQKLGIKRRVKSEIINGKYYVSNEYLVNLIKLDILKSSDMIYPNKLKNFTFIDYFLILMELILLFIFYIMIIYDDKSLNKSSNRRI